MSLCVIVGQCETMCVVVCRVCRVYVGVFMSVCVIVRLCLCHCLFFGVFVSV